MTDLKEAIVTESGSSGSVRALLWASLAGIGLLFCLGGVVGFLSAHNAEGGGPLSVAAIAVLACFTALGAACGYAIWRQFITARRHVLAQNRRERLSWTFTAIFCVVGAATGIGFAVFGDFGTGSTSLVASTPISPLVAIVMAGVWGVIMPVAAWFWHNRAIDELEAAAYRDGGYYAGYAFLIIAPLWWILWRGGFLPAPDGVALYLGFATLWCIVWYWKKYH